MSTDIGRAILFYQCVLFIYMSTSRVTGSCIQPSDRYDGVYGVVVGHGAVSLTVSALFALSF